MSSPSPTAQITNAFHSPSFAQSYNARTGGCNIQLADRILEIVAPLLPGPSTLSSSSPSPSTTSTTTPATTAGTVETAEKKAGMAVETAEIAKTPLRILDSACGPLILSIQCLTTPLLAAYDLDIDAADISEAFIAGNREVIRGHPEWNTDTLNPPTTTTSPDFNDKNDNNKASRTAISPETSTSDSRRLLRIKTAVMDSMSLQYKSSTFHLALSSLALHTYPSPLLGLQELHRVLLPRGVVALTTWKNVGWLPLLHSVQNHLGHTPTRFPTIEEWAEEGRLKALMQQAGFKDVREREVVVEAMWEGGEGGCAGWVSETIYMMMVGEHNEQQRMSKEALREGFERVLREEREEREKGEMGVGGEGLGVLRREGGKVGFQMRAWVGVGRK